MLNVFFELIVRIYEVFIFQVCRGIADVGFILDSSTSIRAANRNNIDNWELIINFVIDIIRRLSIALKGTHVGIVNFSSETKVEFNLDTYYNKNDMITAIRNIEYMDQWTNPAGGIEVLRTEVFDPSNSNRRGDRVDVPDICIIITDGAANINHEKTVPYANMLKNDGCILFAVGVTNNVNRRELELMSSNGRLGETYWLAPNFASLTRIIDTIVNRTCERLLIGLILPLLLYCLLLYPLNWFKM